MEAYSIVVNPDDGTLFAAGANVTNTGACPAGSTCPSHGTGVLKSTDCGATWTKVSTGMNGDHFSNGALWAMLLDPKSPSTMYVANGYGTDPTIYRSTNGGVDWTELNPDPAHVVVIPNTPVPPVQAIAMDPSDPMHLAVTFHNDCAAPYNPLCLSQSTDGGDTWTEFNGPTSIPMWTISGWMEGASLSILGAQAYLFLSPAGTWYTGDGGKSWTQVIPEGVTSNYAGGTHIAPDGTLYIAASNNQNPVNIAFSPAASNASPPFALAVGAPSVMALSSAPPSSVLIDDGVYLYATNTGGTPMQPFWKAPLDNPTAWTQMPDIACGPIVCRGANQMAYDANHHVVYSANWGGGLWRLVTE